MCRRRPIAGSSNKSTLSLWLCETRLLANSNVSTANTTLATGTADAGKSPMNAEDTGSDRILQPDDATEAQQMGAFVEDALTLEDAEQSRQDLNTDGEAIL